MHPKTLFAALSLLLAPVQGIVVPRDLGDGFFTGIVNSTGGITWTKEGDLPAALQRRVDAGEFKASQTRPNCTDTYLPTNSSLTPTPGLSKRDEVGCTGRRVLWGHTDIYESFKAIVYQRRCSTFAYQSRTIFTMTLGDWFWYGCNYQSGLYYCNPQDVEIAYVSVKYRCGDEGTGWDHLDVPNFTSGIEQLGYGVCAGLEIWPGP
ncbi:hypothetical protein OQA88_954 [Cercophora sp. LCS_1]